MITNRGYANNNFRIMEQTRLNLCKYCNSGNIKKDGMRNNKQGKIQ